jgi:hypothetical protein
MDNKIDFKLYRLVAAQTNGENKSTTITIAMTMTTTPTTTTLLITASTTTTLPTTAIKNVYDTDQSNKNNYNHKKNNYLLSFVVYGKYIDFMAAKPA